MTQQEPGWTIPLEDGLIMRGATPDDADPLAAFNSEMHPDPGEPPEWIGNWTRDLLTKPHPAMSLDDVLIVEDQSTGKTASTCVYFQSTWSYCGIRVPFGRPELVSTHPDYRNRGLIRKQFEQMHRWGDERGHLVQGITGIPYFYRQFGYEMALEMPASRSGPTARLPSWDKDETKSVTLRQAERSDVPFIHELVVAANSRSLFSPEPTPEQVEYLLFDPDERSMMARTAWIIEDAEGKRLGSTVVSSVREFKTARVFSLEFVDLSTFRTHTRPFLCALHELLEQQAGDKSGLIPKIEFSLFSAHPAQPFIGRDFQSSGKPYAWYIRTPDLPKLLKLISPKLEERLVGTVFEGLTGHKMLYFFRSGISVQFESGRIKSVEQVRFPDRKNSIGNFPELTFLNLLFGRKSASELRDVLVDAGPTSDENEALLDTLFPKMPSDAEFAIS